MKQGKYDYLKRFNKKPTRKSNTKTVKINIESAVTRNKSNGDVIIFLKGTTIPNAEELNLTYDPNYGKGIELLQNHNKVLVNYWSKTVLAQTGEEITYNNISKIEALPNDEEENGDLDELLTF